MFDRARKEGRHKGARPSGLSVQVRMSKPEKRTKYNPLSSSRLKVLYLVTVASICMVYILARTSNNNKPTSKVQLAQKTKKNYSSDTICIHNHL